MTTTSNVTSALHRIGEWLRPERQSNSAHVPLVALCGTRT
jgi:hypothetical protein